MSESAKCMRLTMVVRKGFSEMGAPESPLSPHGIPSSCFPPSHILKAHVHTCSSFIECNLLSLFRKPLTRKHTAESIHLASPSTQPDAPEAWRSRDHIQVQALTALLRSPSHPHLLWDPAPLHSFDKILPQSPSYSITDVSTGHWTSSHWNIWSHLKTIQCLFPPSHGESLESMELLLDGGTGKVEKAPAKLLGDCNIQCY